MQVKKIRFGHRLFTTKRWVCAVITDHARQGKATHLALVCGASRPQQDTRPDAACRLGQPSQHSSKCRDFSLMRISIVTIRSRKIPFSTAYPHLNDSTAHYRPTGLTATRLNGLYSYLMAYDLLQHSGPGPEPSVYPLVNMRS